MRTINFADAEYAGKCMKTVRDAFAKISDMHTSIGNLDPDLHTHSTVWLQSKSHR